MQDDLVFSAAWKSPPMMAQEVVGVMQSFLEGFPQVSPWQPPFDVSGKTKRLAHMPIAEDFSNFNEVLFKAMDNKEVRFFSESEPEATRIKPDSKSVFGMHATFSDYPQRKLKKSMVTINMGMGSSDGSCNGGIDIHVPAYTPYIEENGVWAMSKEVEQPEAILDYLIEFFDPLFCSVYSSKFVAEITEWGKDINSPIGWRSYVRNPKVIAALKDAPCTRNYRDGVLIEIGDTPVVFKDTNARKDAFIIASEIRDTLRAAEATDWMAE